MNERDYWMSIQWHAGACRYVLSDLTGVCALPLRQHRDLCPGPQGCQMAKRNAGSQNITIPPFPTQKHRSS